MAMPRHPAPGQLSARRTLSSSIMDSAPSACRPLAESAGSGGPGPSSREPLPGSPSAACSSLWPRVVPASPRVRGRRGVEERSGFTSPLRPRPLWAPKPWTRPNPDHPFSSGQRKDILEELTKSQKVFSEKLDHLSRRLAWVHATVYSQVSGWPGPAAAALPATWLAQADSPSMRLPPRASGTHMPPAPPLSPHPMPRPQNLSGPRRPLQLRHPQVEQGLSLPPSGASPQPPPAWQLLPAGANGLFCSSHIIQ